MLTTVDASMRRSAAEEGAPTRPSLRMRSRPRAGAGTDRSTVRALEGAGPPRLLLCGDLDRLTTQSRSRGPASICDVDDIQGRRGRRAVVVIPSEREGSLSDTAIPRCARDDTKALCVSASLR